MKLPYSVVEQWCWSPTIFDTPSTWYTILLFFSLLFQATSKELRELFSSFGQLKRVRLPKKFDGGHRGFAFVDFLSSQVNVVDLILWSFLPCDTKICASCNIAVVVPWRVASQEVLFVSCFFPFITRRSLPFLPRNSDPGYERLLRKLTLPERKTNRSTSPCLPAVGIW